MTPAQIGLVEETIESLDLDTLATDFYERALTANPSLAEMFTTDPIVQRVRFAAELAEIVRSIRSHDRFALTARALGVRHRGYGVRAAHYQMMGAALFEALARALGSTWTPEVEDAWRLAYNLTAETMMQGALEDRPER